MYRRSYNVKAALILICLCVSAFCSAEQMLYQDDFDSYNEGFWGSKASTVELRDGALINSAPQGHNSIVSLKKYSYASLDIRMKFDRISGDSTNFYYYGFQSVLPWAENVCYFMVQDGSVSVNVHKSGGESINQPVGNVEAGRWYTFSIVRQPDRIDFLIDGKNVFKTENPQNIPDAAIPIFIGANNVGKAGSENAAVLEIDRIQIISLKEDVASKAGVSSSARKRFEIDKTIGDMNDVFILAKDGVLYLENRHFINEINFNNGLRWKRLFNKQSKEEYLSGEDLSGIFTIVAGQKSISSMEFDVNSIALSQDGKIRKAIIRLVNDKRQVGCELSLQIDDTQEMLYGLKVTNQSTGGVKLKPIFPIIGTVAIGGKAASNQYFFPWRSGIVGKVNCDLLYEYGGLAWMQVVSIFDESTQSGLYVYPKDDSGTIKGMILKKTVPQTEGMVKHSELTAAYEAPTEDILEIKNGAGFAYYYFEREVGAGEQILLPPTAMGIYRGGWKEALKNYSVWAHTWYKHVNTPKWFMNCFNFLPQHKPAYYSAENKKYVAAERLAGSEHIVQWAHWWDYKEQANWPADILMGREQPGDFDYNAERGGLDAFKKEIKKMQDKGTRFTVYVDHRFCCKDTRIGKAHGNEWAAIYRPGGTAEGYGGPTDQYVTCFMEPNAWPDYLAEVCGRIVKDTGMDGIYLDELALPFACYNPNHLHNRQYKSIVYIPAFAANIAKSREAMVKENPEAILMTEHAGSDYFSQFIDGSWSQTFYELGFPFSTKYFDDLSVNYFHFCFPEFKLAEWGGSKESPRRCFFNGIGVDWGVGSLDYLRKTGQVMKENGDAFASMNPEPIVETKIKKVLANKFRIEKKTVYTIYNKLGAAVDGEIIEVEPRPDWHWVELVYDNEIAVRPDLMRSKDVLAMKIDANDVVCAVQFPKIIYVEVKEGNARIKLNNAPAGAAMVAYFGEDTSQFNKGATKIDIQNGEGALAFGQKDKVILKLMDGDILIDEVIFNAGK
ncbi:MAG: DUF6259 domain-containing protein [Sedimentisphaerales bacterium]